MTAYSILHDAAERVLSRIDVVRSELLISGEEQLAMTPGCRDRLLDDLRRMRDTIRDGLAQSEFAWQRERRTA